MRRGSIVWINLEDTHPPELGKTRPAVVVSNSDHNLGLETVVVIPLSTRAPAIWPLRMPISLSGMKRSFAVVPGIRQVSKERLLDIVAITPSEILCQLDRAVRTYLSD